MQLPLDFYQRDTMDVAGDAALWPLQFLLRPEAPFGHYEFAKGCIDIEKKTPKIKT